MGLKRGPPERVNTPTIWDQTAPENAPARFLRPNIVVGDPYA
jgi:hypothetical protein